MNGEYEVLDLTLRNVSLFLFTLMVLVECHYNFFKIYLKRLSLPTGEDLIKQIKWQHLAIPPFIGVLIAASFYPTTYFTFMPFHPNLPFLDAYFTGIICGRAANGGHDAFKIFGDFFSGWVGRIRKN